MSLCIYIKNMVLSEVPLHNIKILYLEIEDWQSVQKKFCKAINSINTGVLIASQNGWGWKGTLEIT